MQFVYDLFLVLHFVGLALLLGGFLVQVRDPDRTVTRWMFDGALTQHDLAGARCYALSGRGAVRYDEAGLGPGDVVVFGAERAGLAPAVLDRFPAGYRFLAYAQSKRGLDVNRSLPGLRVSDAKAPTSMRAFTPWSIR